MGRDDGVRFVCMHKLLDYDRKYREGLNHILVAATKGTGKGNTTEDKKTQAYCFANFFTRLCISWMRMVDSD